MQTLKFRRVPWTNPVAVDLRASFRAETDRHGPGASKEYDGADVVVFVIAYELATGQPVGCGGLRRLPEGSTTLDYVYVVPYARWSGIAHAIAEELVTNRSVAAAGLPMAGTPAG